jgi:hypothetical protein
MNLNDEIQKITDKVIAEKLPKMVEDSVSKMLESVISDVFGRYSDMSKDVKKKIEGKLDINLQEFDLIDYNALVAKAINENLLKEINLTPILEMVKNTIGFVNKKSITLSEIVEIAKEAAMEDGYEESGEISFLARENTEHKWVEIFMDIEKKKREEDCAISFIVSTDRNNIFCFKCKDYWTNLNPITPSKLSMLGNFEQQIFRLYSAQVKVVIDELDFDTEWCKYD